jgi:hypothetical protein
MKSPDAVLAPPSAIAAMKDILVASTHAGREVAGVCTVRDATAEEIQAAELDVDSAWYLTDFQTRDAGDAWSVHMPAAGPGELGFHTHPGLQMSMAGFSQGDIHAVETLQQPLMVVGYTSGAPDSVSFLALAAGLQGAVVTAAVQAALRLEATGRLPTDLLRVGIAGRVLLPGGQMLPVRRAQAPGWRRMVETGTFEVDRAMMKASNAVNGVVGGFFKKKEED